MQAPTTTENAVHTIVALLTDRKRSVMELCDLTGLDLPTLAQLIESEPVQAALEAVRRITAIRLEFVAAESDFIATAVLQDIAKSTLDAPRTAEMARKAANAIRTTKAPAHPKPSEPRASARAVPQQTTAPNPTTNASPNPKPQLTQPTDRHRPKQSRPSPATVHATSGSSHPP